MNMYHSKTCFTKKLSHNIAFDRHKTEGRIIFKCKYI